MICFRFCPQFVWGILLSGLLLAFSGLLAQERVAQLPDVPDGLPKTTRALIVPQLERSATIRLALEGQEVEEFEDAQGLYWFLSPAEDSSLVFNASKSETAVELRVFERDGRGNWLKRGGVAGTEIEENRLEVNFSGREEPQVLLQVLPQGLQGNVELELKAQELVKPANDLWQNAAKIEAIEGEQIFSVDSNLIEFDLKEAALPVGNRGGQRPVGRGMWWRFKAPERGDVIVKIFDNQFDTILGIAELKNNAEGQSTPSFQTIEDDNVAGGEQIYRRLTRGQELYIYADSFSEMQSGAFRLSFEFFAQGIQPPSNDRVSTAQELGLLFPQRIGGIAIAANPPGKQENIGLRNQERGLWWAFKPLSDGRLSVKLSEESSGSKAILFAKKRGRPLNAYQRVQESEFSGSLSPFAAEMIEASVSAQKDYLILLKSRSEMDAGLLSAEVDFNAQKSSLRNDLLEAAIDLGSVDKQELFVRLFDANKGAEDWQNRLKNQRGRNSRNRGYQNLPYQDNLSVWYRWTAPNSGWLRVSAQFVDQQRGGMLPEVNILEAEMKPENKSRLTFIWENNQSENLLTDLRQQGSLFLAEPSQKRASELNSQLALQAVKKGKTYYIRLSGGSQSMNQGKRSGLTRLSLNLEKKQSLIANDDIADALEIQALPYRAYFKSQFASVEKWEEGAVGYSDKDRTLWWKYTAPRKQTIQISARNVFLNWNPRIQADVFLRIARFDEQNKPSLVYSNYMEKNVLGNKITYSLEEGESLYMGAGDRMRSTTLELLVKELNAQDISQNDELAQAQQIFLNNSKIELKTHNSTLAQGEPRVFTLESGLEREVEGSLWYRYEAQEDGVLKLGMQAVFDVAVEVYELDQAVTNGQKPWPQTWEEFEANSLMLTSSEFTGIAQIAMNNRRGQGQQEFDGIELKSSVKAGAHYLIRVLPLNMSSFPAQNVFYWQGVRASDFSRARLDFRVLGLPEGDSLQKPLLFTQENAGEQAEEFQLNLGAATAEAWEKDLGLRGEESLWILAQAKAESWLRVKPNSELLRIEIYDLPQAEGELPQRAESFPLQFNKEAEVFHAQNQARLYRFTLSSSATNKDRDVPQALSLSWEGDAGVQVQAPVNDNFAQATLIEEAPFEEEALDVSDAGLEEFEPQFSRHLSVWYRLVIPEDGNYRLSTKGSNYNTFMEIYSGDATEENIKRFDVLGIADNTRGEPFSELELPKDLPERFRELKELKAGDSFLIRISRNIPEAEKLQQNFDPKVFRLNEELRLLNFSLEAYVPSE